MFCVDKNKCVKDLNCRRSLTASGNGLVHLELQTSRVFPTSWIPDITLLQSRKCSFGIGFSVIQPSHAGLYLEPKHCNKAGIIICYDFLCGLHSENMVVISAFPSSACVIAVSRIPPPWHGWEGGSAPAPIRASRENILL